MKKKNWILNIALIAALALFVLIANIYLDSFNKRILNLCAIYVVLGLSMNLINGFTGLFSLGHAGFMALGAYVTALLTLSPAGKERNFFLEPIIKPLATIELPFFVALIIGGIVAAIAGYLIGAPALRLKGDYLAIATLGFSEIIRIVLVNAQNITNGSLGLNSIPVKTNMWWAFGVALFTVVFMLWLINSSYGRAFKAIKEDEIAAESMGINLFKHKVLAFTIGAFFAGIGGGLLGSSLGTIEPNMFKFTLTFNILLIVVLGGMGSITGTVISAFVITIAGEVLRVFDQPMNLGFIQTPGLPGLRMVIFSALLMVVILFFRNGLMGNKELTWDRVLGLFKKTPGVKGGKGNELTQNR